MRVFEDILLSLSFETWRRRVKENERCYRQQYLSLNISPVYLMERLFSS